MTWESTLTWSWLHILTRRRYEALRQVFGDLETPLEHFNEKMLRELGMRQDTIEEAMKRYAACDTKAYALALERAGVCLLSIEDEAYPPVLRDVPDAPVFLTYRGDLGCLDQPLVGIVGTRRMSTYGKRIAGTFVPPLVRAGMVTVSGLALGIDAEVARETIRHGGHTVAVLGGGLGAIHPSSNTELAEKIVESGGLLVSEFPLDFLPNTYTFPARNRIIAGLSMGCLVLEAPVGSGALITADLALEYGRDVFAVPGPIYDPNFDGSHALISASQARLVTHPSQLLEEFKIIPPVSEERDPFVADSREEEVVYAVLTTLPQSADKVSEKSGLGPSVVASTLTMLELKDAARTIGSGHWVRV